MLPFESRIAFEWLRFVNIEIKTNTATIYVDKEQLCVQ